MVLDQEALVSAKINFGVFGGNLTNQVLSHLISMESNKNISKHQVQTRFSKNQLQLEFSVVASLHLLLI
jgi:hypothetical protein